MTTTMDGCASVRYQTRPGWVVLDILSAFVYPADISESEWNTVPIL